MKTLHNSDASRTQENVPDVVFYGDGDLWQLLCKASSDREGWMKSTKVMNVPGGSIMQITTQQRNSNEDYVIAEALVSMPGIQIYTDIETGMRSLMPYIPKTVGPGAGLSHADQKAQVQINKATVPESGAHIQEGLKQ